MSEQTFLEDIRAERQGLIDQAEELRDLALRQAREAADQGERIHPVVLAVVGGEIQLFFPSWRNDLEKKNVFAEITEYLAEHDASAAVTAVGGLWLSKVDTDMEGVRSDDRSIPAVIVSLYTPSWKELSVHTYEPHEHGVSWGEVIQTNDFETDFARTPELD